MIAGAIVVAVVLVVFVVLVSLPDRMVHHSESDYVSFRTGVNTLNLNFTVNFAGVNVTFEDVTGKFVSLNVSACARVGFFDSPDLFDLAFDYTVEGNVLTVTSEVNARARPQFHDIACDICIDPSMNTSLNIKTGTGGIILNTQGGVILNSLDLEVTKGEVEAGLVKDVVVAGDISVKTSTGSIEFSWDNVIVTNNVLVNIQTTNTGGVDVDIKQHRELLGNVTLKAEAAYFGNVNFAMDIQDEVGAIGRVTEWNYNVHAYVDGFDYRRHWYSNTEGLLKSHNYPAGSNFDLTLKIPMPAYRYFGSIHIDATYTP